jgi:ribosome-associated translation inhibitor RaiA
MSENEKTPNLDILFQSNLGDIGALEDKLRAEADTRIRKLAKGNTDIVGSDIIVEPIDNNMQRKYLYRARVLVYMRPDDQVAVEESDTPLGALKGALDAVERQVREKREKLRERWKQG